MKKILLLVIAVFLSIIVPNAKADSITNYEPPYVHIIKPTPTATYYIDADASNGGNGTIGSPWNDIMDADGDVQAGALIKIKGIFSPPDDIIRTWDQSGTVGNEIVFEPWDAVAIIKYPLGIGWAGSGNNIIFDGGTSKQIVFDGHALEMKYNLQSYGDNVTFYRIKSINNHLDAAMTTGANIQITGGDGVRIINSELANCVSVGMYIQGTVNNIEIKNNIIHNNGGAGIQFNPHGAGQAVTNANVTGNIIYDNGFNTIRGGINITNTALFEDTYVNNVLVANNFIWGGTTVGIQIGNGTLRSRVGNVRVYNNTIYNNGTWGILASVNDSEYTDPIIINNILYENYIDIAGEYTGTSNITSDPLFVSTDANSINYLKLSVNSPAIEAGVDLQAEGVDNDFFAISRPQGSSYDIGAYEYLEHSTYYLSPDGDNISGDGSYDNPWFSPRRAKKSTGAILPGDTVVFKNGTYNYDSDSCLLGYNADDSGTIIKNITYKAETREAVFLNFNCGWGWRLDSNSSANIILDGFTIINAKSGVRFSDANQTARYINVTATSEWPPVGRTCDNATGGGGFMTYNGAENFLFEYNIADTIAADYSSHGVYIHAGSGIVRDSIFRNNLGNGIQIQNNGTFLKMGDIHIYRNRIGNNTNMHGIYASAYNGGEISNLYVYNNLVWNTGHDGINGWGITISSVDETIDYAEVKHNTVYAGRHGVRMLGFVNGGIFANNISYGNDYYDIGEISSNVAQNDNLIIDPLFESTDEMHENFLMLTENSPAKNTAENEEIVKDILGVLRPQGLKYDIGAFEYQENNVIRANVDGENGINTIDAMLTLRNSLGLSINGTSWKISATTGDVNCDSNSNSIDAVLLLRYSLGLDMSRTQWCE